MPCSIPTLTTPRGQKKFPAKFYVVNARALRVHQTLGIGIQKISDVVHCFKISGGARWISYISKSF